METQQGKSPPRPLVNMETEKEKETELENARERTTLDLLLATSKQMGEGVAFDPT